MRVARNGERTTEKEGLPPPPRCVPMLTFAPYYLWTGACERRGRAEWLPRGKVDSRMLWAAGWYPSGKRVNWRPYYHGKPKIKRIIEEKSNGKAYLGKLTTWQFCRCLWDTGPHCDRPARETALRDDPFCAAGTWDMRKLGKVTWPEGVPCRHLVFPSIFVCFTQRSLPNYALTFLSNMILLEINNRIIEETLRAKFSA